MTVYKIETVTESLLKENIKLNNPILQTKYYLITCDTEFFIQLDNVIIKNNIENEDNKLFINIYIKNYLEKKFLIFDNYVINVVHDMFPIWFDKDIDMEDLLEYYVPTILEETNHNIDNDINDATSCDMFSYDSSEDIDIENKTVTAQELDISGNKLINIETSKDSEIADELFINCGIPYNYEENDLDIMILDSSNNIVEKLWNNLNLMGKNGKCILKFTGLKIEKDKFSSLWELIQLKILD